MLSKRQTLLEFDNQLNQTKHPEDELVYFTNVIHLIEDAGEDTIDAAQLLSCMFHEDTWAQMGSPTTITVTVEGGDTLNPVKDPAATLSDLKKHVGGKKVAD